MRGSRATILASTITILLLFAISGCDVADDGTDTAGAEDEEFDAEQHFSGETITIVVGFSAGGGYDSYARLLAAHMSKHIPGEPAIEVENMPGGGGAVAGGFLQDEAEPDGLTIGMPGTFILPHAVGDPDLPMDVTEFEYLGDVWPEPVSCIFLTDAAADFDELQSATSLLHGNTAANTDSSLITRAMEEYLDVQVDQLVTGYAGGAEMQLALETGEIDGYCLSIGSVLLLAASMIEAGEANILAYASAEPLGDSIPGISDDMWLPNLAGDEETRDILETISIAARGLSKLVAVPPGTPDHLVSVLRDALQATTDDPQFRDDAEAQERIVDFLPGEEVAARIQAIEEGMDPELMEFVRSVILGDE